MTKTVPHRTGRENLLGTGYTFGLARYNYQCTSVSTAEPLLSICALRLKRRRWRELDPGCMCQQWGTVLSQLRFDRGVDGRAHCSSRGRTGAWATARTRTQTRLCVFTVGRCNQPSPAHQDPLDPQPVTNNAALHPHFLSCLPHCPKTWKSLDLHIIALPPIYGQLPTRRCLTDNPAFMSMDHW